MEKDYILNDEEIVLIEKFREEQEEIDRKVKYFNFLSIQEDIENKTEFISIRQVFLSSSLKSFPFTIDGAMKIMFVIFVRSI